MYVREPVIPRYTVELITSDLQRRQNITKMPSATCSNRERKPVFVDKLGEKYVCCKCRKILNPPVMQTTCGHRLSEDCLRALLSAGHEQTVLCPGNEEDCERLTTETTYPDNATTKEMQRFKVYCSNKDHGCGAVIPWQRLANHDDECPFKKTQCTSPGCDEQVFAADLKAHVEEQCEWTTVTCEHCDEPVPRRHLPGHVTECETTPRKCAFRSLGCEFEGRPDKYKEHLTSSLGNHTAKTVKKMGIMKLDQNVITSKIADMEDTIRTLRKSVTNAETTSATPVQTMQRSIAKLSDDLNVIREQVGQCASRDQLQSCTEQINGVKQMSTSHESRIAHLETGSNSQPTSNDVIDKVNRLETKMSAHDLRFAESDLRFRLLETAAFDGRLLWRIPSYSRRKQDAVDGRTLSLYSQPFYSSYYGYKMCARVYLNGDGLGKGSHMSLFFVIMKGEYDPLLTWPFRQKVTLSLMDLSGNRKHITDTFRPDPTSSSFQRPVNEMNIASGSPLFAPHGKVESAPYLKDYTLFICVTIDKTDLADVLP